MPTTGDIALMRFDGSLWARVVTLLLVVERGDVAATLQVGVDAETQAWDTTLTTGRAVTLSTTGAYEGATFAIIRTSGGAFNLDVGGLINLGDATTTKASVTVVYDGAAWRVKSYSEWS